MPYIHRLGSCLFKNDFGLSVARSCLSASFSSIVLFGCETLGQTSFTCLTRGVCVTSDPAKGYAPEPLPLLLHQLPRF